jgi:uncharacterized RDD family membrane protein YckC
MSPDTRYPLAPLGRRAGAWALDATLGVLIAAAFVESTGGRHDVSTLWHLLAFKSVNGQAGQQLSAAMNPSSGPSALRPIAGLLVILTVITIAMVAYRVVTTALWGAGLGKALFGLKIVVDTPGEAGAETPSWARSWKRWAVPLGPGLIPLPATGLLAFAPALRDQRRRGLHDRAAGTIVIDVRSPLPDPAKPADPSAVMTATSNQDFFVTRSPG